jgi:hypothetical protein
MYTYIRSSVKNNEYLSVKMDQGNPKMALLAGCCVGLPASGFWASEILEAAK